VAVQDGASDRVPSLADSADEQQPSTLESSAQRISEMVADLAALGRDPAGGNTRLAYSREEREAHDLVGRWMRALGLEVDVDAAGNTIGDVEGPATGPRIVLGSHVDTVRRGGRFDGVAGVVGALEVVRAIHAGDITITHPLRIVCFAGAEGGRFGLEGIGSRVIAGRLAAAELDAWIDDAGMRLSTAMRDASLRPESLAEARWPPAAAAAFLELHVEQASSLEDLGIGIGIVDQLAGNAAMTMLIAGRADDSGTNMRSRGDALAAAAEIVLEVEATGLAHGEHGARATVSRLVVEPNASTTVPGLVELMVDLRDLDGERLRNVARSIAGAAGEICQRRRVGLDARVTALTTPAILTTWVRQQAVEACRELGIEYRILSSGFSHDTRFMNEIAPSGLVFIPSRSGLSHVPDEWTSSTDIARGVGLLAAWVVRLDQHLTLWSPPDH
jgi:allantoate deiminase